MSSRVRDVVAPWRRRLFPLLAGSLIAALVTGAAAEPPNDDTLPLEQIIARENANDPWSIRIVSVRCTAFYIAASALEKEERPALSAQYEDNAERFLSRGVTLPRTNKDVVIGQVTRLSRMYYLLSQEALEAHGDPFEHPLLRADLHFCMRLIGLS